MTVKLQLPGVFSRYSDPTRLVGRSMKALLITYVVIVAEQRLLFGS